MSGETVEALAVKILMVWRDGQNAPGGSALAVAQWHAKAIEDARCEALDAVIDRADEGIEFGPKSFLLLRGIVADVRSEAWRSDRRQTRADARVEEVREFARGLLAYEAEHASGTETPTLIAVANDLLAIVGRDDAEQAPA